MATQRRVALLVSLVALVGGCSEGDTPFMGGDASRDSGRVVRDGATDGAAGEGGVPGRVCRTDTDCDDEEGCTLDRCDTARAVCVNTRDTSCNSVRSGGSSGRMFRPEGQQGVAYDDPSMGLIVRADSRRTDYLWIPNVAESTLSKWDARTATEVARYRVGLPAGECVGQCCHTNGCNMPSRVVVDSAGDAYIANRGFRMQGSVSKIAADRRDCVDRNGNGMIDTSAGPMDVRPFNQDECVLWTANVGPVNAVLRSLAIDRGDERFPDGTVWVGGCVNAGAGGNAGLFQLNPRNGMTMREVPMTHCAYGAVVTSDGTLWEHAVNGGIIPVNVTAGTVGAPVVLPGALRGGCGQSYGITADARNRLWLSGRGCRDIIGYDPATMQWSRVDLSPYVPAGGSAGLGITIDPMNRIWVPISASGDWTGNTSVASVNADDFMGGATVPASRATLHMPTVPHRQPTAVGADLAGNIWVASAASPTQLLRFEPAMNRWQTFSGPNQVYTYTDFTGGIRRLVIGSGRYSEDYETCDGGTYGELYWNAETPMGTSLAFSIQIADSATALAMAPSLVLGIAPRDRSPINIADKLRAAGVTNLGRFARITVTFNPVSLPMVATPILRSLSFTWRCGGIG
ncbi:MAG: hypothetical protein JNK05_07355 [Myxococcales bacterium]|nr:hypothetical protein [Myxococcales bacterium]